MEGWRKRLRRGEVRFRDCVEANRFVRELMCVYWVCSGGIRTIPPGFTRGLDFGPIADGTADGELLEEEEEVEVTPIYRPMMELAVGGSDKGGAVSVDCDAKERRS